MKTMKNITYLLILLAFLFSCKKHDFDINNLNGNKIGVIGHGGMGIGHTYPMNTLEGFLNALNLGPDGVEIDVQMTKDGVLVAFHDQKLEESTNLSGHIYDKTWTELVNGQFLYPHYGNYKLIRLDDVFKSIPNQDKYTYFLDFKNFQPNKDSLYFNKLNTAIINIIDKYNLLENTYVEFKSEMLIVKLQETRPDIKQFIYAKYDLALSLAEQYNLEGITVPIDKITIEKVQLAHSKGIMVATFNTHSHKRNINAVEHNVDFIHTDRLKHLIGILKN